MPHVREVRATPHEDHDAMLVAALAAGDLAGTDRDHATALVEGCSECASLHDDLQAIARATATLPPPLAMPARDFRLSPQQAARLRRAGWRRLLPAGFGQSAFTRPLGVGLATFGLIGLLVTNVPIGFGLGGASSAAAPESAAGGGAAAPVTGDTNAAASAGAEIMAASAAASVGAYPAASAAAAPSTVVVPAASGIRTSGGGYTTGSAASGSALPREDAGTPAGSGKVSVAGGSGPVATAAGPVPAATERDQSASNGPSPADVRNVVFVAAIAIGLGLLILARRARRLT